METKYKAYAFYFTDSGHHIVPITRAFPARELIKEIPGELRTFRFTPYIDGFPPNSTHVYGIYGLLDEFHAYYHGLITKTRFYRSSARSNMHLSFFEFKYYILKYLLYAKKRHRRIYNDIMKNQKFKKIFRIIHNKFERLATKHFEGERKKFLYELRNYQRYSIDGIIYQKKDFNKAFESRKSNRSILVLMKECRKPGYVDLLKQLY